MIEERENNAPDLCNETIAREREYSIDITSACNDSCGEMWGVIAVSCERKEDIWESTCGVAKTNSDGICCHGYLSSSRFV